MGVTASTGVIVPRRSIGKCPRPNCGGSLEPDEHGDLKCMLCARAVQPGFSGTPADGPPAGVAPDWKAVASARLDALLGELARIEALREEAETIHAALTVAGAEPAPLPWAKAPRRSQHRTFPACARCGRQFTASPQYQRQPDRTAICRGGCPGKDSA